MCSSDLISIISGICEGVPAIISEMFDFTIFTENGQLSLTSPFLNDKKIGNDDFAVSNGLAITSVPSTDIGKTVNKLLSFLPDNFESGINEQISEDNVNRLSDITKYKKSCDIHDLIDSISDQDTFFEISPESAKEATIGFSKFGGQIVGIVANNYSVNKGLLTIDAAKKISKHVSFCNSFNIPIISIVDSDGIETGGELSCATYSSELARLAKIFSSVRVPTITLHASNSIGIPAILMGSSPICSDVSIALKNSKIDVIKASTAVAFLWNEIGRASCRERV